MEKKIHEDICKDTDIFALLCHCYGLKNWEIDLSMADFTEGKNIISIKKTIKKHKAISGCDTVHAIHAISGCDTVSMYYGKVKKKALNIDDMLKLSFSGQVGATEDHYLSEPRRFIAACYSSKKWELVTEKVGIHGFKNHILTFEINNCGFMNCQ